MKARKTVVRLLSIFIPNRKTRKEFRKRYEDARIPKNQRTKTFVYEKQTFQLFESAYHTGFHWSRMTERCLEVSLAKEWLKKTDGDVIEIGAVTPYYFSNKKKIKDICDPHDAHEKVNKKFSMFKLNLTGRNVLSISTVEHIATGEYGIKVDKNESAVKGVEKIIKESKSCLITFPAGYNRQLDEYFSKKGFQKLKIKGLKVFFFTRNETDNRFKEEKDLSKIRETKYGPMTANGVIIIEKEGL